MKLLLIPNNLRKSLKLGSSLLALVVSRQKSSNRLKKEEITHCIKNEDLSSSVFVVLATRLSSV
jgi:hypothetical protein